MIKNIILVSIGVFQTHIIKNINQLLKLGFKSIHIITEYKNFTKLPNHNHIHLIDSKKINVNYFNQNSKLNKRFRNGFWNNTSKRFFIIYEYMKSNDIKHVLHLENDVLLYSDMNYDLDDKIYLTMDSKNRCVPGIIYIPRYELLTKLIDNFNFTQNDMINLAKFYTNNKDIVKTFPIIDNSIDNCIYNENFQEFNSIFDGAAIGQYLGGVDPRNISGDTTGFVNETCEIKYDKYTFKWLKKGKYYFPYIEINNNMIFINNLHIHCKKLENFRMENPVENKYIQIQKDNKFQFDLIIVVYGCDSIIKYKNQILKIKETYEKTINKFENIKILYFLGNKDVDSLEGENLIHIKLLEDNYFSASYKQWFGLNYVYRNFNTKFIMCIGTDTFINIPKLIKFLKKFNPKENLYIGGHGCHRKLLNIETYFHSGGPGFILSKACLNKIYPKISDVDLFLKKWINICKKSNNTRIICACDVTMGYLSQMADINSTIKKEQGFYHCNHKGYPCHRNKFPYKDIISCHNMSLNDFDEFNSILLDNNFFTNERINFITGEKIQFLCDHFIGRKGGGRKGDFGFNPNVAKYKERIVYIGNNEEINNKPLIFCYTHLLNIINDLISTLKRMKNPFKIVFHNSDTEFNNNHIILFDKLPLLQCIYTQNMNIVHEKVLPLPIGLANSQWTHGNSKIHQEVYDMPIEKSMEIYFNFNKNTNRQQKRYKCYNDIIKKGIKWNKNLPYKKYLIELKKHKYAICPVGNGIDTHRFWECLYMNVIPICKKNRLVEYYSKFFPIVLLNDWNDLDLDFLKNEYSKFKKIDHKYLNLQYILKAAR
ncbi:fringe family glycosyltransferase [bacterium]|nr:fringe family glycosyltransferase [bacterium]